MSATGFSQGNSGTLFISNPPAALKSRAAADNQKNGIRILEIEYTSLRTDIPIHEDKIRSNIRSKTGDLFSINVVDEDIKHLYQTGDFQNVQICASEMRSDDGENGVRLTVLVDPKLRVEGVDIKRKREDGGLDDHLALKKVDLLNLQVKEADRSSKEVSLLSPPGDQNHKVTKSGDILSPEKLHWDAQAMEKLYKEKGYYDVRIDVKEEYLKDGKSAVTFEILEGMRGFIKKVRILGNHEVSEMDLLKVINLKPNEFSDMGAQSDLYDELILKDDVELIKNLYLNRGFVDVSVRARIDIWNPTQNKSASGSQSNLIPNAETRDLILCYRIEEGQRYGVEKISVSGNTYFSENDILKELRSNSKRQNVFDQVGLKMIQVDGLTRGRAYSVNGLQASIETLQNMYGREGFREARIEWKVEPGEKKGDLNIHFNIAEGEKIYVERIKIYGNVNTKDAVIRREIQLVPGEVFDTEKEKSSKENILKTGLFSNVESYAEETERHHFQNLIIKVVEKPEQLTFGIGVDYFWNGNSERSLVLASKFPFVITLSFSQNWGIVLEKICESLKRK